jgi:hypothetical protein
MRLERKIYTMRKEKVLDFVIGFAGWFLINGLLYGCSILVLNQFASEGVPDTIIPLLLGVLPLLINIAALIFFAFTRRWIALGALAAFALVLVAVLLIGLFIYTVCLNMGNI